MIGTAVLTLLYFTILGITTPIRNLADVTSEPDFISAINTASGYISAFDNFLPMGTLITILGLFIAFELFYFTYKVVMWVIKKIPTIN